MKKKLVLILILGLFLGGSFLYAQAPTPTGRIYGTVADSEGNLLPGVTVEATSPRLVGRAATVTDSSGVYRLMALTPGTYRLTFTLQGFKPLVREGIVVQMDQSIKLDVSLEMGAIEEEITVVGQAPLIDVKSTTKGMTLTRETFAVLPRGRNFDSLATAVPGVNNEPWVGGLSVDGATVAENVYLVDGSNVMRNDTGRPQQSAAFEFVEEVKIIASGYGAEHGGAMGGVVSIITRQGGNEFHGEVIGYYDGAPLSGTYRDILRQNPADIMQPQYVNYQTGKNLTVEIGGIEYEMWPGKDKDNRFEGGFSLGGYIIKDRLWFFGSFLPVYRERTRKGVFLSDPTFTKDYTRKDYAYNGAFKLTAQPAKFMRVGGSFVSNFTKYRGALPAQNATSSPTDPTLEIAGFDYPNYSFNVFADLTFGNNMMINVRGGRFAYDTKNQQYKSDYPRQLNTGYGIGTYVPEDDPLYRPVGWQTHPRIEEIDKYLHYKNYANADFTYYLSLAGEHAFKAGVEYVRQGEDVSSIINQDYPDVYFYWDRSVIIGGMNYGRGEYGYYEVRGSPETGVFGECYNVHNDRWAVYAQDSWTIKNRFTLNIGLRAESEYVPPYSEDPSIPSGFKPIDFGWDEKIAPRIGFVYDVLGDSSLKVFGSYGLYYDVIKTYMAAHSYAGFKWKSAYHKLDQLDWTQIGVNGNFPGETILIYDWRYPSFESTDPDLKPVSQREVSFGVEKLLKENLSFTARFVQKHLRYAIEDVGVIVYGVGELYFESNPGYGLTRWKIHGGEMDSNFPETPRAKREYYGINLSLDKRLSNNWLGGISYTWSRLAGNYSGLASSEEYGRVSPYVERLFDNWAMQYTKELEKVDGPLTTDRTHFIKAYAAYTFPFNLTVGAVLNAMSGTPFTETWNILSTYWFPFNHYNYRDEFSGQLHKMRNPFLTFVNFYAEYNLKFGRYTVNFNLNIDNLFDTKTARRTFEYHTLYDLDVSEDTILSRDWDLGEEVAYVRHPLYMMERDFYGEISARVGIKFIF